MSSLILGVRFSLKTTTGTEMNINLEGFENVFVQWII